MLSAKGMRFPIAVILVCIRWYGHTVRMMAPKFVVPYRMSGKRGKNDAADAAAICEAVTRPNMRFVPVKSIEQQSRLFVHRARQGYVEQRTAHINRIRGLLSELGIVLPLKAATVRREDIPLRKCCLQVLLQGSKFFDRGLQSHCVF